MSAGRKFRAGLIGAGYVSPFHIKALRRLADVEIVGICDLDRARAETAARDFGLNVHGSLGELTAAGADVLHVLTPPDTHAAIAIEALERGCHVLVEKPLATRVEDCDRIISAAKKANKIVCVNHSLLYDPFVKRALDIVRSGAVGEILTIDYFRSSDYPPYRGGPLPPQYREGGYPFRDLGVHALYLVEAFLGRLQDVAAQYRSAGSLSTDPNILFDEWRALVRCERGSGQIQISWNVKPLQHVLLIQGTRGVLRADLFSMTVTVKKNTPFPKSIERLSNALSEGRQICTQVSANALRFLRKKLLPYHGLQMLVADFYDCLASDKAPPVTPEEARSIVEWTESVAREADGAKERFLQKFPRKPTAKILVTGAGGFIGRHLLQRLMAGEERVRIFVRREPPAELMNDPRVETILGDLGDPKAVSRAVEGVDLIYHVGAAMKGGGHDFERGTVTGTRNVVESALKHGVKKLVHVSSLSVLHAAAAREGRKIKEDWPLEPHPEQRGYYTQTKLEAERLVLQAVRERDLYAVILRPGQVFGPGAPLLTPAVARRAGGRFLVLGNGRVVLPLVYVEDVVDAILLAARRDDLKGSIFHLVDTAEMNQNDFLSEYLTAMGRSEKVTHVPLPVVCMMALGMEGLGKLLHRPIPLSRYRVRSALAPLSFDCRAAEFSLGWKPKIGVQAGLEKTFSALRAAGTQVHD